MIGRELKVAWRRPLILAALLFAVAMATAVEAAESTQQKVPFHDWTTLRTRGVVLQKLDFSCGAASVATLATFFLGKPTTEEAALRIIRARYTPDEWKKKKQDGLSMEDLVYIAKQLGFDAQGGRLGLAALLKLNGPVIVHLDKGEFQHFTVLRGINGMTVFLADPVFGSVPMSMGQFIDQFTGAVLAVWDPAKTVAAEHPLKLKESDSRDGIYAIMRPSMYNRPQPLGPGF